MKPEVARASASPPSSEGEGSWDQAKGPLPMTTETDIGGQDEGLRSAQSRPVTEPACEQAATEGAEGSGEEFLEFKEALSDLRSLRHEYECLNGGGPGWGERNRAAWARVGELFANEDEAAWCREQEDAYG